MIVKNGEKPNLFIDPNGWKEFISRLESDFQKLIH